MLNTLHILPTWEPERSSLQTWTVGTATIEPWLSKVPAELAASATDEPNYTDPEWTFRVNLLIQMNLLHINI